MFSENTNEVFTNESGQPAIIQSQRILDKKLTASLEENVALIKDMFFNDDTLKFRRFGSLNNETLKCCLVMIDGLVDNVIIEKNILTPIYNIREFAPDEDALDVIQYKVIAINDSEVSEDPESIAESLISGDTLLIIDGYAKFLLLNTKGWKIRSVEEPSSEKIMYGPKEGFIESMLINLGLIRRKIRSPDLKFKFKTIGARTKTRACIVYHEALVNQNILAEVIKRIDKYNLDAALGDEYLKEMIRDAPYSPFDTIGSTERPDIVAARILEGRVAIVIDGTPEVMTIPYLFIEKFQANQDYYANYMFASMMRITRMVAFFLTISMPAIYLSVVAFHQEFLPTPFLLSMMAARQGVPFPTIVELVLMLAAFELLREAGARMPTNIGQALSIVGALVLGQAAVQAKIVSAPIIIVTALSAISGLLVQRADAAIIVLRVLFIASSFILGIYGYLLAIAGLALHLLNLRSFGVAYMLNMTSFSPQELKDTIIRAPWWLMNLRTKGLTSNLTRRGSK